MSEKVRREKLFKVFAQNLEWVKERVDFIKNIPSGYMCPLCTRMYTEEALKENATDRLTIEHVPPDCLKGKPLLLTCKKCNSDSGHSMDANLKLALTEMDFTEGLANSEIKTSFHHEGKKVNGKVSIDKSGTWQMEFGKNSHPDDYKKLISRIFSPANNQMILSKDGTFKSQFISPRFTFTRQLKADKKLAEVSLLRIAYLLAFNYFGYGFIVNPILQKVREQILNPEKDILPRPFWIKYDFSNDPIGAYLIKEPKTLRSFMVTFEVTTNSKSRKVTIVLPGFSEPGIDLYQNLRKSTISGISIKYDSISAIDFNNKEAIFDSIGHWNYMDK